MTRALTNVVGFDDAPFAHAHRGDVMLVGVVCARTRVDGVVSGRARRDGRNATDAILGILDGSQFVSQIRLVLLQGIAVAGFNVIDIGRLHDRLAVPVLVVARRQPRMAAIRRALLRVAGGDRKWRLIESAGPMEPIGGVFVQRRGLSTGEAEAALRATTSHGKLPEALRVAHLIAGGVTTGASRGRA
jgi:endonuclease V-like protein UPF0215 family